MGLKKNKKKATKDNHGRRPKGSSRAILALQIAESDATFSLVAAADGSTCYVGKCIHCGTKLRVETDGSTAATIEHIVPLCDGGDAVDLLNVALACSGCNSEKGIRHDSKSGRGGRSDDVIKALLDKRRSRYVCKEREKLHE